jgi:mono/diheme cytochrome c family protein
MEMGAANHALDLGVLMIDAPLGRRPLPHAIASAGFPLASWGPGRVDVTTREGTEPALIPDLRPVRFQRHLQHSGAVIQRDVTSLAIRIETLIITAHDGGVRPPREVALGLAVYLWSLAETLPAVERDSPGAQLFARHCARCHAGEGLAGALVDVDVIGGDTTLARSRDRGTNAYRITSLRGVGTRERLLHDGSVRSLDDLLDPIRVAGAHRYGMDLSSDDRAALVAWLRGR